MPFNTSIKLHLLCEKHRNFLQWSRKLQVAKDLYKLVFLRPEIRTVLGTSSKKNTKLESKTTTTCSTPHSRHTPISGRSRWRVLIFNQLLQAHSSSTKTEFYKVIRYVISYSLQYQYLSAYHKEHVIRCHKECLVLKRFIERNKTKDGKRIVCSLCHNPDFLGNQL